MIPTTTNRKGVHMDATKENPRPQGLSEILATVRPNADAELGQELSALVEAVNTTGKAGTLTYTLSVKPAGSSGHTVEIADKITAKRPEKSRATSIAFVGEGNTLHRNDPTTAPLFQDEDIRDAGAHVDFRTGEIKEAPGA